TILVFDDSGHTIKSVWPKKFFAQGFFRSARGGLCTQNAQFGSHPDPGGYSSTVPSPLGGAYPIVTDVGHEMRRTRQRWRGAIARWILTPERACRWVEPLREAHHLQ